MATITITINTEIESDVRALRDIAETAAWLLDKSAEATYDMGPQPCGHNNEYLTIGGFVKCGDCDAENHGEGWV